MTTKIVFGRSAILVTWCVAMTVPMILLMMDPTVVSLAVELPAKETILRFSNAIERGVGAVLVRAAWLAACCWLGLIVANGYPTWQVAFAIALSFMASTAAFAYRATMTRRSPIDWYLTVIYNLEAFAIVTVIAYLVSRVIKRYRGVRGGRTATG